MKVNKKCVAGMLAGLIAFNGLSVQALAKDRQFGFFEEPSISKTIEVPSAYKAKNSQVSVNFEITHNKDDERNLYPNSVEVPVITCDPLVFTLDGNQKPNTSNNYFSEVKETPLKLDGFTEDFVKQYPGVYVYDVKESATKDFDVVDNHIHQLIVICKNEDKVPTVTCVLFNNKEKAEKFEFINKITNKTSSLVINKKVIGHGYASNDQKFAITIEVMLPGESEYKTVTNATEGIEVEGTYDGNSWQVNDANSVKFTNLPVGTKYKITEPHTENWKGSASVKNPVLGDQSFNEPKSDLVIEGVVGLDEEKPENPNSVEITNEHDNIDITGVVLDNAPFIAMIVVPAMFFGASLINRRKFNL